MIAVIARVHRGGASAIHWNDLPEFGLSQPEQAEYWNALVPRGNLEYGIFHIPHDLIEHGLFNQVMPGADLMDDMILAELGAMLVLFWCGVNRPVLDFSDLYWNFIQRDAGKFWQILARTPDPGIEGDILNRGVLALCGCPDPVRSMLDWEFEGATTRQHRQFRAWVAEVIRRLDSRYNRQAVASLRIRAEHMIAFWTLGRAGFLEPFQRPGIARIFREFPGTDAALIRIQMDLDALNLIVEPIRGL